MSALPPVSGQIFQKLTPAREAASPSRAAPAARQNGIEPAKQFAPNKPQKSFEKLSLRPAGTDKTVRQPEIHKPPNSPSDQLGESTQQRQFFTLQTLSAIAGVLVGEIDAAAPPSSAPSQPAYEDPVGDQTNDKASKASLNPAEPPSRPGSKLNLSV